MRWGWGFMKCPGPEAPSMCAFLPWGLMSLHLRNPDLFVERPAHVPCRTIAHASSATSVPHTHSPHPLLPCAACNAGVAALCGPAGGNLPCASSHTPAANRPYPTPTAHLSHPLAPAVLASLHFADPLVAAPCALSACTHSVMGSMLAGFWRNRPLAEEEGGQGSPLAPKPAS